MIVTHRSGKFKTRIEIDWNNFDPFLAEDWCRENFKYKEEWISRGIRRADWDYDWYFYFKNLKDATMFMLKWS
jgi:hypothetical protein